jgi:pimeloyl-ACP methyl ester carboxylesterase
MWPLNHRAGKGLLLIVVIASAAVLYNPLAQLFLAGRLLLAVREVVAGDTGTNLAVRETKVQRSMGSEKLEGTLAAKGFFVVTPDIAMFRQFKVTPAVLDEIAFWYTETRELAASRKIERIGIAGISFSATLALIAAAQPQARDTAGFVLGIGAYDDLRRCSRQWFSSSQAGAGEGYYPVRFYAKWILMLAALDMLGADEDRKFLQEVLLSLLLQRPVTPAPDNLTDEGRRWYRLAVMPENESDPELVAAIEHYLAPRLYRQLSPDLAAAEVRCPVFLVHGAYDDLIPPTESEALKKRIGHAKSYILISPFLTHTHPLQRTLSWSEKSSALWDMLGFFYNLAGVVR